MIRLTEAYELSSSVAHSANSFADYVNEVLPLSLPPEGASAVRALE